MRLIDACSGQELVEMFNSATSWLQRVEVIHSGQPQYNYIISVE